MSVHSPTHSGAALRVRLHGLHGAVRSSAPRGVRAAARAAARGARAVLLVAVASAALTRPAAAQYFGRNKVQYETFDFRVLHTQHFDVDFYPEESTAAYDAGRMADRWYRRFSDVLNHEFDRRSIILYADHPDFQQTNVVTGSVEQGTGGVTEPFRSRVVMPLTGVYADNDHVLGHEIVHVFQFDIANTTRGAGLRGMNQLPLWVVEGMAEYLSVGREDPHTAMWLRDAVLRNDIPTLRQLTTDPRYFPYRYGQAFWAYVGGRWGDRAVVDLYRAALTVGWEPAIRRVFNVSADSLSRDWHAAIRAAYAPATRGRARPAEAGVRVIERGRRRGDMTLAPAVSPDGRYVAFFGQRELFTVDLYVAETATGRIVGRFGGPNTDQHFDALSFINSAGAWSPDGRKLAFIVFAQGDNELNIWDVRSRRVERRLKLRGVGALNDPAWSPDGTRLAVSGTTGGISELYLVDLATERVQQLTNGRNAELQPAWSPDGGTIVFATDRQEGTDFAQLTYAPMRLAALDVATGAVRLLPTMGDVKHINPQFSPDGRDVYFVSDVGGFSDVYRLDLASGEFFQVTRLGTGVSGITALSPALSVARQTGRLVFSVFDNAGYGIFALDSAQARGTPAAPAPAVTVAGVLPPADALPQSLVAAYLRDPRTGLATSPAYRVTDYRPSLRLDYVGSQGVGVGVSSYGAAVVGGIGASFSDELGNRTVGGVVQATGTLKDLGGQLFFQNSRRRWNWAVAGAHVPYIIGGGTFVDTATVDVGGQQVAGREIAQVLQRVFVDEARLIAQYPFSTTRHFEASVGGTRLGYDNEVRSVIVLGDGQVVSDRTRSGPAPDALVYASAGAALVGDYSYFGFTSPVAGGRYRFEATPTFGRRLVFQTLLADYRRYFFARPVTLAVRGLHYGRYGKNAESDRLSPLFVGFESYMRGYSPESFDSAECTSALAGGDECPQFDRLIGSRLAVANLELRVPLVGTREFGLINLPYLPVEIAPFADAGVAWTSESSPVWRFERRSAERVPVFSTGVSARINVLGYVVVEAYYAYPFQRPEKRGHFGFQLAPGW